MKKIMTFDIFKRLICFGIIALLICGCRKFVTIPPPVTELTGTSVFSNKASAESALNGVYITMEGNSVGGGISGISAFSALSADEFYLYPGQGILQIQIYTNSQTSNNSPGIWPDLYNLIYQANTIIEGASGSTNLTTAVKQQLIGEAEFIRAFCNFYLVNLYGNVPLAMSGDYHQTEDLTQISPIMVYAQIVADLKDAESRLGSNYIDAQGNVSPERVRPNKSAAQALLARVYLYQAQYDQTAYAKAEQQADSVITNSAYLLPQGVPGLSSVFLTTSQEAIWQLELPSNDLSNTPDGTVFTYPVLSGLPGSNGPYLLSDSLVNSFEKGDLRKSQWVDSLIVNSITYYVPYKYKLAGTGKSPQEYPTVLRLAEQYLIRAEARAQQGNNLSGAATDLNIIRARAGLPPTTAKTKADLLNAILHERRVELFTEYGHRWLDLKRTGLVNQVMSVFTPLKGGAWLPTDALYPIPYSDLKTDPNLKQNPGYQ